MFNSERPFWMRYPFTTYHEMNLDWLLSEVARLDKEMEYYRSLGQEIEELKKMIEDYTEMINAILGRDLVDDANYNLKYQVIPYNARRFDADINASGFCIGEANGRPVALNCFIDGADDNVTAVFTYMDDGSQLAKHAALPWGHANSCCYCPETQKFYVACAASGSSGRSTLVETDLSGAIIHDTLIDGQNVWAVTCANGYLYCLTSGGWLAKVDPADFSVIEKYIFDYPVGFTAQGLFADEYHLYLINGNNITGDADIQNVNRITVMDFKGRPVKQIYSAFPLEMEEGDLLDGVLYVSSNTTHCALIVEHDLYCKNRRCSFGRIYENVEVNNIPINVYCNEQNYSFYMDGSTPAKGLSSIAWVTVWLRNSTTRINLFIEKDITQLTKLSVRKYPNTVLDIDGQGHLMPNLLLESMDDCYINNCIFPGVNNENTIEYHGSRLALNNNTFGESGSAITPSRLVFATSTVEMDGVVLNQTSANLFYIIGNGYIRNMTDNTTGNVFELALMGEFTIDDTFIFDKVKILYNSTYKVRCSSPLMISDAGKTYSINDLHYPMYITHMGGTINDLPAGITATTIRMIQVIPYRTNYVYCVFFLNDNTCAYAVHSVTP